MEKETTYVWVAAFIIGAIICKPELAHALGDMVTGFYIAVALVFVAAIPISVIQGVWSDRKKMPN